MTTQTTSVTSKLQPPARHEQHGLKPVRRKVKTRLAQGGVKVAVLSCFHVVGQDRLINPRWARCWACAETTAPLDRLLKNYLSELSRVSADRNQAGEWLDAARVEKDKLQAQLDTITIALDREDVGTAEGENAAARVVRLVTSLRAAPDPHKLLKRLAAIGYKAHEFDQAGEADDDRCAELERMIGEVCDELRGQVPATTRTATVEVPRILALALVRQLTGIQAVTDLYRRGGAEVSASLRVTAEMLLGQMKASAVQLQRALGGAAPVATTPDQAIATPVDFGAMQVETDQALRENAAIREELGLNDAPPRKCPSHPDDAGGPCEAMPSEPWRCVYGNHPPDPAKACCGEFGTDSGEHGDDCEHADQGIDDPPSPMERTMPRCRFGDRQHAARFSVAWSDRETQTCEAHLPEAKQAAAEDGPNDRNENPTVQVLP